MTLRILTETIQALLKAVCQTIVVQYFIQEIWKDIACTYFPGHKIILFIFILTFANNFEIIAQDNNYHLSQQNNIIGESIFNQSEYESALNYYTIAYNYALKTDSFKLKSDVINNIGVCYDYLGKYDKAIFYYNQALVLNKKYNDKRGLATTYNNIGAIYFFWKKYDLALENYIASLNLETELGDKKNEAASYENIALVYKNTQKYKEATHYFDKALAINDSLKYTLGIARNYNNIGNLYNCREQYSEAIKFYEKALDAQKNDSIIEVVLYSYNNLGDAYLKQKNYEKADVYFNKALKLAEKQNLKVEILFSLNSLSELYKNKSDFKKANYYLTQYYNTKDSVFSEITHRQIVELEKKYKTIEQKIKIETQSKIIEKNKLVMLIGAIFITLSLLLITLLFWLYNKKNRAFSTLFELNIELSKKRKIENNYSLSMDNNSENSLKNKLLSYVEKEKPFLNSHFSIDDLAEAMHEHKKIISKLINNEFDTNFNHFINRFRVIYAQELISNKENKKLTLQAIAEMSGFNTRATFISSFKKFTGKTPSSFLH